MRPFTIGTVIPSERIPVVIAKPSDKTGKKINNFCEFQSEIYIYVQIDDLAERIRSQPILK